MCRINVENCTANRSRLVAEIRNSVFSNYFTVFTEVYDANFFPKERATPFILAHIAIAGADSSL